MISEFGFWVSFSFLFLLIFIIDMFVTDHRKGEVGVRQAIFWSALWFLTAVFFAVYIYFFFPNGSEKSFEFFAAYLVEYSLSVDNLFVFIMIFNMMKIKEKHQPRILKWGIIGAVVLRVIFILAGVELIRTFSFVIYIFGAVLIYTAYKMITSEENHIDPEKNILVKTAKRFYPINTDAETDHFFIKRSGKRYATLALITLLLVESTDVIFAVDSIPAVLAISNDSFIAITSNLFAIIGLRSLFFALAGIINLFRFLKYGIAFILFFVGVKMLISGIVHIQVGVSLAVIISTLVVSIIASILIKGKSDEEMRTDRKKEN